MAGHANVLVGRGKHHAAPPLVEPLQMLVEGYTADEVYAYSLGAPATEDKPARRAWGVGVRSVRAYCSAARKLLAIEARHNRKAEFAKASRRLDGLYRRAKQAGDFPAALAAERERIRLFGLAEPERTQVDVTSGGQRLVTQVVFSATSAASDPQPETE
jgi:hypothetical protein